MALTVETAITYEVHATETKNSFKT